jgi:hypothetical protein
VMRADVMVPAAKHHQIELSKMINGLNFDEMVAFKTDYLADWWAETYQISVADASLKARQQAFMIEKKEIYSEMPGYAEGITFSSHAMVVDSYQLVLLPAWLGKASISDREVEIFIDSVSGEIQLKGLKQEKPVSFWSRLFNI